MVETEARGTVRYDAVLLAGGRASRLGGVDKTAIVADGVTLSDRALAAAEGAEQIVVVGLPDDRDAPSRAVRTREDPPFGGPVAALAAGTAALSTPPRATSPSAVAPWTLVLACDLVHPGRAAAELLRIAASRSDRMPTDGFVAVDDDGRRQPLLALYRSDALRDALRAAGDPRDLSMRRLLAPLDLTSVPLSSAICADVDDPEDVARLVGDRGLLD
ncbi:molybdenum cofactor guanylyltransferase [Curtobacterium sp. RRHDQ66]|uniref:molybdenum cofactor guanylyltransferase n=1 Tax=Curtobacterium guangdongense TaxID=3413380 RepID=UPI003BF2B593